MFISLYILGCVEGTVKTSETKNDYYKSAPSTIQLHLSKSVIKIKSKKCNIHTVNPVR